MPGIHKTLCTGLAQPGLHADRPALAVRARPAFGAVVCLVLAGHPPAFDPRRPDLARQGRGPPADRRARQRARRGGHGHPGAAHQVAGVRALGVHGRLCRRLPRLRHPALQHGDLRSDDLVHHHLHGRDRRPGVDRGRRPRRALSRRPAGPLRRQPDHPVPDQRARADRLHPLPSRRPGRAPPPLGRCGHRRPALRAGASGAPAPSRGAAAGRRPTGDGVHRCREPEPLLPEVVES